MEREIDIKHYKNNTDTFVWWEFIKEDFPCTTHAVQSYYYDTGWSNIPTRATSKIDKTWNRVRGFSFDDGGIYIAQNNCVTYIAQNDSKDD